MHWHLYGTRTSFAFQTLYHRYRYVLSYLRQQCSLLNFRANYRRKFATVFEIINHQHSNFQHV